MSASQEKRRRQAEKEAGMTKKELAQLEAAKKRRKEKIRNSIVGIVLLLALVLVLVINSGVFYKSAAIVIDGEKYSAAEVNYLYNTSYSNEMSSGYGSFLIDTEQPLNKQQSIYGDEGYTWDDYFRDEAINNLKYITALSREAENAGFTLTQEDEEDIASYLEFLDSQYEASGYSSVKQFLQAAYGTGVTLETVENIIRKTYIASGFAEETIASYEYTDQELQTYYDENSGDFDTIGYRQYLRSFTAYEEEGLDEAEAKERAKKEAEDVAKATSAEDFHERVLQYVAEESLPSYEDPDATYTQLRGSGITTDSFKEWLTDSSRKEGDTTVIEEENGYYTLYFDSRESDDYDVTDVRHVLIKGELEFDHDEDDEHSHDEAEVEEAKEAAKEIILARAQELYDEWQAGEATEESFAQMAEEYSDDTGSIENGGLYEGVYKGQMVPEFNDFLFEEGRKPGDTAIVYGESDSYFGYHIMYFVGYGKDYRLVMAEDTKRNNDYSEWLEERLEKVEVSEKFGMKFVG